MGFCRSIPLRSIELKKAHTRHGVPGRKPNKFKALSGKPAAGQKVYPSVQNSSAAQAHTVNRPSPREAQKFRGAVNEGRDSMSGPKESEMQRTVGFKLKQDDYQSIKVLADKYGMSVGQYCRMRALTESNLSSLEAAQREMLEYQQTKLLDRETMKSVIEYLNNNMPRLIYDYFQARRAQR